MANAVLVPHSFTFNDRNALAVHGGSPRAGHASRATADYEKIEVLRRRRCSRACCACACPVCARSCTDRCHGSKEGAAKTKERHHSFKQ
eukprot:6176023-Pleurochrysis_carterae.AAC.1